MNRLTRIYDLGKYAGWNYMLNGYIESNNHVTSSLYYIKTYTN